MKKLMNLKGVKILSKSDQKIVNGGWVQFRDLCTWCGAISPGVMTCYSPFKGPYTVPCIPR